MCDPNKKRNGRRNLAFCQRFLIGNPEKQNAVLENTKKAAKFGLKVFNGNKTLQI